MFREYFFKTTCDAHISSASATASLRTKLLKLDSLIQHNYFLHQDIADLILHGKRIRLF